MPDITIDIILLCLAAFGAGFIDSIVGGGGLLQTPAMLIILPQYPIATIFGTTKIPSFSGTALAAFRYSKRVRVDWRLILPIMTVAFTGALAGAYCITLVDNRYFKPVILVVLIVVAVYTYFKKDFGLHQHKSHSPFKKLIIGLSFGMVLGFYDGLIGPGTGAFLMLAFVSLMGNDFLQSTANAKFVNVATNVACIIYFAVAGHILYQYAIPMAIFNIIGANFGTRMALLKGNKFIRIFFLTVVFGTILRFAYDVLFT